jgi:hypothetical protein
VFVAELNHESVWDEILRSTELAGAGEMEKALTLLHGLLNQAVQQKDVYATKILSRHATILGEGGVDLDRAKSFFDQRVEHIPDRSFALYNFAQLLSRSEKIDLAREYAAKSYQLSVKQDTEADRDLVKAIVRQWPELERTDLRDQ